MIAGLTLLDGRVQGHHKEHLAGVLVREQEQSQHRGHGDLVVVRLTVELEEGLEDLDVIATAGIQNKYTLINVGQNQSYVW